jgi:hypothetical protein
MDLPEASIKPSYGIGLLPELQPNGKFRRNPYTGEAMRVLFMPCSLKNQKASTRKSDLIASRIAICRVFHHLQQRILPS